MQPCVMPPIALPSRITQGCIIFPCVMTISSHLYVLPKLGTSGTTRLYQTMREGLACETTLACQNGSLHCHTLACQNGSLHCRTLACQNGSLHCHTLACQNGSLHCHTLACQNGSLHCRTLACQNGSRHCNTLACQNGSITAIH